MLPFIIDTILIRSTCVMYMLENVTEWVFFFSFLYDLYHVEALSIDEIRRTMNGTYFRDIELVRIEERR